MLSLVGQKFDWMSWSVSGEREMKTPTPLLRKWLIITNLWRESELKTILGHEKTHQRSFEVNLDRLGSLPVVNQKVFRQIEWPEFKVLFITFPHSDQSELSCFYFSQFVNYFEFFSSFDLDYWEISYVQSIHLPGI